ncbi:hypothetical protein PUN28_015858 [Cardiocondyla obscurior]|uniref:Uncharacterized protein n=1 Tax=Cardiocondyla obscurior TaxID=286306 RepID=A0AAW2EUK3_9HYME
MSHRVPLELFTSFEDGNEEKTKIGVNALAQCGTSHETERLRLRSTVLTLLPGETLMDLELDHRGSNWSQLEPRPASCARLIDSAVLF